MLYPFASNHSLREQYRRFETNELRYGLILEDIDTFAADVAQRHAGASIKIVVTGFVDKISWLQQGAIGALAVDRDLRMAGQVCWVGRSSMEVLLELSSCTPGHAPRWQTLGSARFVMVARNAAMTASVPVPPLRPSTPDDKRLFDLGAMHQAARRTRQEQSLAQKPPTAEEVVLMHSLVRSSAIREQQRQSQAWPPAAPQPQQGRGQQAGATQEQGAGQRHQAGAGGQGGGEGPAGEAQGVEEEGEEEEAALGRLRGREAEDKAVYMWQTEQSHVCLMHLQDRNNHHRIFGGHLLRLAYELAFATASLHAGAYCPPLSMDDIAFFHPVPIGCLVQFRSKVVYTEGAVIRVHVKALKVEPGSSATTLTNTFSIAFLSPCGAVPRVVPERFQEYLEYLEGHRQHRADQLEHSLMEQAAGGAGEAAPTARL